MSEVAAPAEALRLNESVALAEGTTVDPETKTVQMHLIRPCVGKGRGRHLYEARMLEKNAGVFAGWKMYVDHESEEARRKAGGLPRSLRDYGGRILETKWDGTVPADPDNGFGQGAVVATVRPSPFVSALIEHDPGAAEASINARATSVRRVDHGGQPVWAVEGIEPRGSVDWVTEAGAGGRVVSLMESVYHDAHDEEMAQLETLTDDEVLAHVRESRPGLLEAIQEAAAGDGDPEDKKDKGADEFAETVKKLMAQGKSRAQAEALAKNALKEAAEDGGEPTPKETPVPITSDQLREAFQSDEGREALREAGFVTGDELDDRVNELAEARASEREEELRESIQADADARANRRLRVRDMRDEAHRLIRESRLPGKFEDDLLGVYQLRESGEPTADLDQVDDVDDDGKVTKTAEDKLREAVSGRVSHARDLIRESGGGARVRGQGAVEPAEGGEGDKPEPSLWQRTLQEAGVEEPEKVYENV